MGEKGSSSSDEVFPIFLAMYSRSLNVFVMKVNVMIIMNQQYLSNNPNRFASLDPSGGNCSKGGSEYLNNENYEYGSEHFYFYFETFLCPDVPGRISGRRSTLYHYTVPSTTTKTTNLYLTRDILFNVMESDVCHVSQLGKTL